MKLQKAVLKIRKKGTRPLSGALQTSYTQIKPSVVTEELNATRGGRRSTINSVGEFYEMAVQYNPASLSFSAQAGEIQINENSETKEKLLETPETSMSVELILDTTDPETAFVEAERDRRYGYGQEEKAAAGEESVREQAEAMIALLMRAETRQIIFCWGNLVYAGELESVSVRYTMFNPSGSPVRASIRLELQRSLSSSGQGIQDPEFDHWNKVLDKFVRAGTRPERVDTAASLEKLSSALKAGR